MIQPLRRMHRRIFLFLVFLLPLFFVAGILGRHHALRSNVARKNELSSNPAAPISRALQAPAAGAER